MPNNFSHWIAVAILVWLLRLTTSICVHYGASLTGIVGSESGSSAFFTPSW